MKWWLPGWRIQAACSRESRTSPFGCSYNNAGDLGLIPGSGRSPGEGNGNSLQYSCLENPMDQRAWWATVHGVTKSRTRLTDFMLHTWQVHQSLVPECLTVVAQEPVWLVELNQMRDLWLERTRDPGALRRLFPCFDGVISASQEIWGPTSHCPDTGAQSRNSSAELIYFLMLQHC